MRRRAWTAWRSSPITVSWAGSGSRITWGGSGRRRPVSVDDVVDAVAGRRPLPERAVLVTFDDGRPSVLDVGLPVLEERGIPAVVHVVAGLLDTDAPLWTHEVVALWEANGRVDWLPAPDGRALVRELKRRPDRDRLRAMDEPPCGGRCPGPRRRELRRDDLRRMERSGVAVGNHSLTHPCLNRCGEEKIRAEVQESHRCLTEILGHEPRCFAYPDGNSDGRVVDVDGRGGYELAFLFDHRLTAIPVPDPRRVSRAGSTTTTHSTASGSP